MPTYTFVDITMKISERDEFVSENPHLTQLITGAPQIVSGSGIKNDSGWKENLSRIASAHPNSALADKVGGRSAAQVKRNEIVKKHGLSGG